MSFEYLNEAFKALNLLQEQEFDLNTDGVRKLDSFMDQDDTANVTRVIDPEADTEEDLKKSYVGRIIINCNVCHSYIFKNKEDIILDEDGAVNSEETCPYCGETAGFSIIGKICPFDAKCDEEDSKIEDHEDDTSEQEPEDKDDKLTEDIDNVSVTTDNQVVTVSTQDDSVNVCIKDCDECTEEEPCEPQPETTEPQPETIEPLTAEEQDNMINNEESEEEEDEVDYDMEELSEEETNEVVEGYLKNVYGNVDSFKTTSASINDEQMLVEGDIRFSSGKVTHTGFKFTPDRQTGNKIRLFGLNEHFSSSPRAFSLVGCVEGKKFIPESLSYRYDIERDGKKQSIKGRVAKR